MTEDRCENEKCGFLMDEKIVEDLPSAKEFAVDHFMECQHKITLTDSDTRMDLNALSRSWTLSLARPSLIQSEKERNS